ncbi:MAG: tetratricopeptide repeat protein [Terriglobales bacterium]
MLQALATMERERGDHVKALDYAEKLAALAPDDSEAQALVSQLRR